jgi:1-acyl-sn-glycerol-3-phosphate acyltransferase
MRPRPEGASIGGGDAHTARMTGSAHGPVYRPMRYRIVRGFCFLAVRIIARIRVEGREHLPSGPVMYCSNHQSWADPIVMLGTLPWRPPLALFGPKEEDMRVGGRNRLITWAGLGVPYKPGRNDLLDTTRRVQARFDAGWSMAIFGEGRIHAGERELLPLAEGTAYFALRAGVPIVPMALNGTSWLGFRRQIRVRFGPPIPVAGRPTREAVAELTENTAAAIRGLVADYPDLPPPGRFGRWLTELFNEWPEGRRPPVPGSEAGPTA